ncbi:hypothetical protein, partial [Longimicrobium sp.]|uniref:hypothetical protein n=1 Tax=Longimicrobium sp. TaxID=2029185 RepID=UPI002E307B77
MSQVTYTIALVNASALTVYSGSLAVQLNTSYGTPSALAALLSLNGLEPLVLAGLGSNGGAGWNFYGSNDALNVATLGMYGVVPSSGQAPAYLAGSISLATPGQGQQNLLALGFLAGS